MRVVFHGSGQYPDGTPIGPRCWPHHDLIVVRKGHIRLQLSSSRHELSEGDAILVPARQHFIGEGCSADAAIWVLHFREDKAPKRSARLFRHRALGTFANALLVEIAEVWRTRPRRTAYLDSLAQALLARLSVPDSHSDRAREKRNRLIQESEGKAAARVSGLARQAGFCDSHYRALFREAFGETPRAYLRTTKINEARHLLRETRMPIKDIAIRVGYGDTVAFHRAFTTMTGCTPARYRKSSPPAA